MYYTTLRQDIMLADDVQWARLASSLPS